jgi:protein involved in polysaccharide export with SLBB domain
LGTVPVIGLNAEGIRDVLEVRCGTLYSDPVIEVVANIHVNVTGAVGRPGRFFLPSSATLIDAIAIAAGSSSEVDVSLQGGASDPGRVRLVRDGVSTVVDMRPLEIRPEVLVLRIQSGDMLHVPRALRSQRRDDITFISAILSALVSVATLIVLAGQP